MESNLKWMALIKPHAKSNTLLILTVRIFWINALMSNIFLSFGTLKNICHYQSLTTQKSDKASADDDCTNA